MTAIILQQTMKTDGQMENANSFLEQYLCHNKGYDFAAKMQEITDGQTENANSILRAVSKDLAERSNKGNDFAAKMQVLASRLNKTWKNQKRWSKEGPYVRE